MEPLRQYEEIEPYCKWEKDTAKDVLQVHIQGFKKENLRVELKHDGILMITGNRVVNQARGIRFTKEIRVPDYCTRNEIRAKLTSGVLHITMPKKSGLTDAKTKHDLPCQLNQEQTAKQKLDELASSDDSRRRRFIFGLKRPQMDGPSALKLGALVAVLLVVSAGTYVAYKYHQSLRGDI